VDVIAVYRADKCKLFGIPFAFLVIFPRLALIHHQKKVKNLVDPVKTG